MKNIEVTKEKILQATISEFSKKGLKFTMDDIANNLVMSKKLFIIFMIQKKCC